MLPYQQIQLSIFSLKAPTVS